jgi:type IV pilus assembly protein PilV
MLDIKQNRAERHGGEAGFTLLEVIVAVSILTIGLLAVASMQTAAIRGNDTAYHVTESATWAQNRLEALIALPFNDPLLANGTEKADPTPPTPDGYSITYDVEDGPVENTKLITVVATEQDQGATRVRRLTYIKSTL